MNKIVELKKTIGNYTRFANMQFPLDCDGLADVQVNNALLSVLGNIGGDKYILAGLNKESGWAGYVFLGTDDFKTGELLYVQGTVNYTGKLVLKEEQVNISASGYGYAGAYTKRFFIHGVGGDQAETYQIADFKRLETNASLSARVDKLTADLEAITPTPAGVIVMWSGLEEDIPNGWALCNGERPTNGSVPTPNLKGRFIVGYDREDDDYNKIGNSSDESGSGHKKIALEEPEMPAHFHQDGRYALMSNHGGGTNKMDVMPYIMSTDDYFMCKNANTSTAGLGLPHENRPPYYVLAYIIKL
jgi:microcystin-dependent protein